MKRIPQLDGLRGIAVLMVFGYHAAGIRHLARGVDLFFVLSGYLITGILLRLKEKREATGYWWPFYSRRLRRIAPPYVIFILFIVLFFPVPWGKVWYWYAFFGANFADAFGKTPIPSLGPLWSLAVEEQFYFMWPLLVLLCSRKALRKTALAIVVLSPVLRAVCTPLFTTFDPIYCLTPFRIDLLASGAFVAVSELEDPGWIVKQQRAAFYCFLGSGALLLGLSETLPNFRIIANSILFNALGYTLIVLAFGAALVLVLGMRAGMIHTLLVAKPLRYMGWISYTFYLYQVPILEMIGLRLHSRMAVVILGFLATGILSAVSWHFIESPLLKWRLESAQKLQPDPA